MLEHYINKDECPDCKRQLDHAISLMKGSRPIPGDVTLCIGCGAILIFTEEMRLRLASPGDVEGWDHETQLIVMKAQKVIREVIKEGKG